MKRLYIVAITMVALATAGCRGGSSQKAAAEETAAQTGDKNAHEYLSRFPEVTVPSVINDRGQMIEYVTTNYWNEFFGTKRVSALSNLQLSDSSAVLGVDTAAVSDALAMYLTIILPQADLNTARASLRTLVKRADTLGTNGDRRLLLRIMQLGEYIYYNPNSPYRNEELYLPVVEEMTAARSLSEIEKIQFEYPLRMLRLNRIGTKANNFKYEELTGQGTTRNGSLYSIDAPFVLLFFNNPGCEACEQFLNAISNSNVLPNAIANGKVKVLSMYIDEDLKSWKEHKDMFPDKWIYARDPKMILRDNAIYGIRAIPSVYLLDRDKRVLLKDGGPESIPAMESYIGAI